MLANTNSILRCNGGTVDIYAIDSGRGQYLPDACFYRSNGNPPIFSSGQK